jgi:integrase
VNFTIAGKRYRKKVGRKSDAIAFREKAKADSRRGILLPELCPKAAAITFGALAKSAIEYAKAHLRTWKDYDWKERTLRQSFGSRAAAQIQPLEIDQWLTRNTKTPATANRFRAFFSLCYRLGIENGKVTVNPARLVRARREDNARLRFLSHKEYERLSEIIRSEYPSQHPAFVVSVFTGMRWSEQFHLRWSQLDLRRELIRLTGTKDPTNHVQAKTRIVPLNSIALQALKEQQQLVPNTPEELVFPQAGSYCRFWFEPSVAEAGINRYTWHNNRHTFCSWQALAGASLREIQELAGHRTITMTVRYAHLSPEAVRSASERIVKMRTAG